MQRHFYATPTIRQNPLDALNDGAHYALAEDEGLLMLHLFILLIVFATQADTRFPNRADAAVGTYATREQCIAAATSAGAKLEKDQLGPAGEKVLGGVALCLPLDVPTGPAPAPEKFEPPKAPAFTNGNI